MNIAFSTFVNMGWISWIATASVVLSVVISFFDWLWFTPVREVAQTGAKLSKLEAVSFKFSYWVHWLKFFFGVLAILMGGPLAFFWVLSHPISPHVIFVVLCLAGASMVSNVLSKP